MPYNLEANIMPVMWKIWDVVGGVVASRRRRAGLSIDADFQYALINTCISVAFDIRLPIPRVLRVWHLAWSGQGRCSLHQRLIAAERSGLRIRITCMTKSA